MLAITCPAGTVACRENLVYPPEVTYVCAQRTVPLFDGTATIFIFSPGLSPTSAGSTVYSSYGLPHPFSHASWTRSATKSNDTSTGSRFGWHVPQTELSTKIRLVPTLLTMGQYSEMAGLDILVERPRSGWLALGYGNLGSGDDVFAVFGYDLELASKAYGYWEWVFGLGGLGCGCVRLRLCCDSVLCVWDWAGG